MTRGVGRWHTVCNTVRQKGNAPVINLLFWVLFGAFIGWIASIIMRRDAQQGTLGNIVVGIVGAGLGGFLFNRGVTPSFFSLGSMLVALVGAILLLGVVNLAQRGTVR